MARFRLADVTKTVAFAVNALPGYKTVDGAIELHAINDQSGFVTIIMSNGRRYDVTITERARESVSPVECPDPVQENARP